ncbi:MAG: hypothetical protein ACTICQ_15020 [Glutamicibacter arilaitensis]|uniref:hypothetical protein n=1 Tax=Glutamicibacter arilaitensis TaxID=256701 RepID=UPI003FBA66B2
MRQQRAGLLIDEFRFAQQHHRRAVLGAQHPAQAMDQLVARGLCSGIELGQQEREHAERHLRAEVAAVEPDQARRAIDHAHARFGQCTPPAACRAGDDRPERRGIGEKSCQQGP